MRERSGIGVSRPTDDHPGAVVTSPWRTKGRHRSEMTQARADAAAATRRAREPEPDAPLDRWATLERAIGFDVAKTVARILLGPEYPEVPDVEKIKGRVMFALLVRQGWPGRDHAHSRTRMAKRCRVSRRQLGRWLDAINPGETGQQVRRETG